MKIDLTGVPSVVAAESAAPGIALAESIVTPKPLTNSMNGIVRDLLDAHESEVVIIIDPNTRKVTAASGAQGGALLGAIDSIPAVTCLITPDAGQTGRSLTFTAGPTVGDFTAIEVTNAINAATVASKPKRSVESLVGAILGAEMPAGHKPVIVVDQTTGIIHVMEIPALDPSDSITAAINAIANAGDRVQIELSADPDGGGAAPAVFEGGAV